MLRKRTGTVVATLTLAACLSLLATVEWSYPYCMQPADGPAYPAVGFPLPYAVASHVSSLEFLFMPHVLALNLLLAAGALFPVVMVLKRLAVAKPALRRVGLGVLAALGLGALVIGGLSLSFGVPVMSIGDGYVVYRDLRPIGLTSPDIVHSKRECTPSQFWFSGGGSTK